jgi:hypothetical protein
MEVTESVIDYTVCMCTIQENNAVRRRKAKSQAKWSSPLQPLRVFRSAAAPLRSARGTASQRSGR